MCFLWAYLDIFFSFIFLFVLLYSFSSFFLRSFLLSLVLFATVSPYLNSKQTKPVLSDIIRGRGKRISGIVDLNTEQKNTKELCYLQKMHEMKISIWGGNMN